MDVGTQFDGPDTSCAFGMPASDDGYFLHFTGGSFVA